MQEHYYKIVKKISDKYNVKSTDEWLYNKKAKLKRFQSSLEIKIKEIVIKDINVATEFISKKVIHTYINLTEERRRESIEKYILSGEMVNPKIDLRTLEAAFNNSKPPSHKKILNAFSIYIYKTTFEYSYSLSEEESTLAVPPPTKIENIEKKLHQFYGTHWWVYYFHYEEENRIGKIGRAVLRIDSKYKVILENVESETSTHYVGNFDVETSNQHLYFDLTAIETKEKHLRITLYIGVGKVYPLLLGVYTNIYATNSMAAGCIVFEKVDDISIIQEMKPISFNAEEAEKNKISLNIVDYLSRREKNFIKSPSGILTISKLGRWLQLQKQRK